MWIPHPARGGQPREWVFKSREREPAPLLSLGRDAGPRKMPSAFV
jgi:hypothetical protein